MQKYSRALKPANQILSSVPLANEQIFRHAPSVMAESKHHDRGDRYAYVSTIDVIEGLRKQGFEPFYVGQSNTRDESRRGFTRHIVRLRHADQVRAAEANEVVLVNSHDGTSSYQMMAGVLNFVCSNGLFVGNLIEDIRIPHRGNVIDNVIEGSYTILRGFDKVDEHKDVMKSISLTSDEHLAFARSALALKYDDIDAAPIRPIQLLTVRRPEDHKPTLWNCFNVVQENLIRGGLPGVTANRRRTRTRPVNSITENAKLNRSLWTLAEAMTGLKKHALPPELCRRG